MHLLLFQQDTGLFYLKSCGRLHYYPDFCVVQDFFLPGLLIWGLIGGFMGGLLGIGGGLIFVIVIPDAARVLGVPDEALVSVTVANSLACTFITTFATGILRFSAETSIRKPALLIGLITSIVSILVLKFIVNPGYLSPAVFHWLFISMLIYLSVRMFLTIRKNFDHKQKEEPMNQTWKLVSTGILAGLVSPLSGLGGGVVLVPFLHAILHFPISAAQAISLNVIAVSTLISTLFNMAMPGLTIGASSSGLLLWPIIASMGPLAALGSILGSRVAAGLKPGWSGTIFFLFLLFILLKKILSY